MTNLLLTLCPPLPVVCPPLAMASLATYVRTRGYSVSLYDLNTRMAASASRVGLHGSFELGFLPRGVALREAWDDPYLDVWLPPRLHRLLQHFEAEIVSLIQELHRVQPAVVGFSIYRHNLVCTLEIARRIRAVSDRITLILGGPFLPGEFPIEMLDREVVDAFVACEGEQRLEHILARASTGGREAVRELTATNLILEQAPFQDLDKIPPLRYDGLDLSFYEPGKAHLITSRGCPHRCSFCTDRHYHGPFRSHSINNVLAQIQYLTEELGRTNLVIYDLTFNANPKRLAALCQGILDRGFQVSWDALVRVNTATTAELLALMKKAGCHALMIGLESGSDTVLRRMNKGFTVAEARHMLRDAKRARIETRINLIVGFPGEEESHHLETIHFLETERSSLDAICVLSTYHLMPNSEVWHSRETLGLLPAKTHTFAWEGKDGNTLAVRLDRCEHIVGACMKLGIRIDNSSLGLIRNALEKEPSTS